MWYSVADPFVKRRMDTKDGHKTTVGKAHSHSGLVSVLVSIFWTKRGDLVDFRDFRDFRRLV